MSSLSDHREPDGDDYQRFRLHLRRLDQSATWSSRLTVAVTVLVSAALLGVCFPALLANLLPPRPDPASLLVVLLTVVLLSNASTLYQRRQFNLFRHRLAEQMDVAAAHRVRAHKFYGMSIIDSLTGLYNRRFGEERLKEEIARAEGKERDLAVIVLDLDCFKQINDQLGHAAGDLVLKEFSRRLRRATRTCDIPVRLGGDEFLVVLPECSRENVRIILYRLAPFDMVLNRQRVRIAFSRGYAQYQIADTPEALVERADRRLYAEKQARKNAAAQDRDQAKDPHARTAEPHQDDGNQDDPVSLP